jgi:hypothetical protein
MKYVVSFEQKPETCDSAFALWDNKYDVGYDWFDFDEMVDGISMFDDMSAAIEYAREVLPEVFFDKLYVIAVNEDEETECVQTIESED